MIVEEAIVVAAVEEVIVAAKAEEAIEDKDKSSHRLIGDNNKDEGSGSNSSSVSSEIPTTALARVGCSTARDRRRLRRDSGGSGEVMGW